MKDISCHILDIVQNALHAGANRVEIVITENTMEGIYRLYISDNGSGMDQARLQKIFDPFYTTSANKKVGLGLPLLKQNAEQADGSLTVDSIPGKGTKVTAIFKQNHIDCLPDGDTALTMKTLIASNPETDFFYRHTVDAEGFEMDTAVVRKELDGVSLRSSEVLKYLVDFIRDNLKNIYSTRKVLI